MNLVEKKPLIQVRNLTKCYSQSTASFFKKTEMVAVDQVSFTINQGETLGLVGESGSGKSTIARILSGLQQPTAGEILFAGQKREARLQKSAYLDVQMIFQDPYASLNPRQTIREILGNPLIFHRLANKENVNQKVQQLLEMVQLPKNSANRYPYEFSGGQRQRIGIARAISLEPKFIICDEPVSALDVSVQAQILNLLRELQEKLSLTMLFIGHDLGAVSYISDRIAVIYQGHLVEVANTQSLFEKPMHPYTRMLFNSIPIPDPTMRKQNNFEHQPKSYPATELKLIDEATQHYAAVEDRKGIEDGEAYT